MDENNVAERVAKLITKLRDQVKCDDAWDGRMFCGNVVPEIKNVGSPAVPFLLDALATDDVAEGRAIASIIGELGELAVPRVAEAYGSADEGRRQTLAEVSAFIGLPAIAVLRRASKDRSFDVRMTAVHGLSEIGEPALEDLIRVRFSEPDPEIRGVAGSAIRDIGAPAVDALAAKMGDPDPDNRFVAVRLLGSMGVAALAPLSSALEDLDKEVRVEAVKALCGIGEPALGALAAALDEDDAATREMAVNCISAIGLPALGVLATAATSHNDDNVRTRAVVGLGKIGEPALDAIVGSTGDRSATVRSAAYSALYQMAGAAPRALRVLVTALEDEDGSLVEEYYTRLPKLSGEPQDTVRAILDTLVARDSQHPSEHFNADSTAEVLAAIAARRPRLKTGIVTSLRDLAFGKDGGVRLRAVAVARRLGASEFTVLVRERAAVDPDTAGEVMRIVGGAEAAAFFAEPSSGALPGSGRNPEFSSRVFVVHGHDGEAKQSVARLIERLGLEAIILHEQPNQGRTIIEKFEDYADVGFAVVLLTPDDIGAAAGQESNLEPRARQNVILELGFFIAKLGRHRVCALRKGDVEIPSDILGVAWIPLDGDGWRLDLASEIKEAGLEVDLNDLS